MSAESDVGAPGETSLEIDGFKTLLAGIEEQRSALLQRLEPEPFAVLEQGAARLRAELDVPSPRGDAIAERVTVLGSMLAGAAGDLLSGDWVHLDG